MKKLTRMLNEQLNGSIDDQSLDTMSNTLVENLNRLTRVKNPIHEQDKGLSNIIERMREKADSLDQDQLNTIINTVNAQHGPLATEFIETVFTDDFPVQVQKLSPKQIAALHTVNALL